MDKKDMNTEEKLNSTSTEAREEVKTANAADPVQTKPVTGTRKKAGVAKNSSQSKSDVAAEVSDREVQAEKKSANAADPAQTKPAAGTRKKAGVAKKSSQSKSYVAEADVQEAQSEANVDVKADVQEAQSEANVVAETEVPGTQIQEQKAQSKFVLFFKALGKNTVKNFKLAGKTIWRWGKYAFVGGKAKELSMAEKLAVEKIENPTKMIVKNFFSRKLSVISLIFLVAMFLFVFIGPAVNPIDLSYTESLHQNLAPGFSMLSVPNELKNNVDTISSFSFYSVGLSDDGKVYTWGNTALINSTNNSDMSRLPSKLTKSKVRFVSAGYNHAIAITEEGKVVGWGEKANSQYGHGGSMSGTSQVIEMPDELIEGTIDVDQVKQLECGYQVTAIVMKDGSCYYWGNKSGASNLTLLRNGNMDYVAFTNSSVVAVDKDGKLQLGSSKSQYDSITLTDEDGNTILDENGQVKFFSLTEDYLADKTIKKIATTSTSIAILTTDNKLIVSGVVTSSANKVINQPSIKDETIIDIMGGAKHYTVLTDKGNIYSWGDNNLGQCNSPSSVSGAASLEGGAFQTYVLNKDGKILESWGLKGYLMGTDDQGRDVATRVMNGGKMTMTIGAVAVIISSIIGIIVGCLAGYFGGWVDMLLMRVTEVFSSLPFLPFALILSAVLAGSSVSETTRIFIIMVVLGLLSWTGLARMIRGQVLAEREKEFVTAAKAMGVKESKIAFKHILPNIISIILVSMTLDFAGCMLTEASLSYLGFGVRLPSPTWGNMLNGCNNEVVIANYWWRWLFPALFLLLTTISINIIGDTLRDVMDPKSSSER